MKPFRSSQHHSRRNSPPPSWRIRDEKNVNVQLKMPRWERGKKGKNSLGAHAASVAAVRININIFTRRTFLYARLRFHALATKHLWLKTSRGEERSDVTVPREERSPIWVIHSRPRTNDGNVVEKYSSGRTRFRRIHDGNGWRKERKRREAESRGRQTISMFPLSILAPPAIGS